MLIFGWGVPGVDGGGGSGARVLVNVQLMTCPAVGVTSIEVLAAFWLDVATGVWLASSQETAAVNVPAVPPSCAPSLTVIVLPGVTAAFGVLWPLPRWAVVVPSTVSGKVSLPFPLTTTLVALTTAPSVLVKVQVIVSPGSGRNVAVSPVPVDGFAPMSPVQAIAVAQPAWVVSVASNVGLPANEVIVFWLVSLLPSDTGPPVIAVPSNENVSFGWVLETTSFLVNRLRVSEVENVQVIVSPGSGRNVAAVVPADDTLLWPLSPEHELTVDQPVWPVSVAVNDGLPVKSVIVFSLVSLLPSDTGPPVIAVPAKLNVAFGCVLETTTFLVISFAPSVFVKVQGIVSPGSGRNVAVRTASEDTLL